MITLATMSCGACNQYKPKAATKYEPKRLANGVYELLHHPGDARPYNGKRRADAVYVVAIGTEDERIFRKSDRSEAVRYAKSLNTTLDQFGTVQLAEAAMLPIFGA